MKRTGSLSRRSFILVLIATASRLVVQRTTGVTPSKLLWRQHLFNASMASRRSPPISMSSSRRRPRRMLFSRWMKVASSFWRWMVFRQMHWNFASLQSSVWKAYAPPSLSLI